MNTIFRNRLIVAFVAAMAALLSVASAKGQTPGQWELLKGNVNLYLVNDMGRNGYYDQKPIAELMGTMAETIGPEAIIAAGDIHHFNGVASVNDPLWTTNYEHIYSHPELMLDWFPILGNHEYRGDTTPLIDRYREETDKYPYAVKQDVQKELDWLDQTLRQAKEDWVIVVGHHPIYAETSKAEYERTDMQKRVMPILHRYNNVSIYACGHIHNFQHIRMKGDPIDYVVNSAGALSRKVKPIEGTVFCSGEPGFSVIAATQKQLKLHMIDKQGRVLHTVTKQK